MTAHEERELQAAILLLAVLLTAVAALALWRAADRRSEARAWTALAVRPDDPPRFDPRTVANLPEPARRYFLYTIRPGTPLRSVARIVMGGEIGLGTKTAPGYQPMNAHQILASPDGFVWRLETGLVTGSDVMTARTSWTRFWLAGLVPMVRAGADPDHFRSAFGRVVAEGTIWTPAAVLPGPDIRWEAIDAMTARVTVSRHGMEQSVEITVAPDGQPTRVVLLRWSNANSDRQWRLQPFGGDLANFREFGGYRLPTTVEGGNLIGTEDYFPFFKAQVSSISFEDLEP